MFHSKTQFRINILPQHWPLAVCHACV